MDTRDDRVDRDIGALRTIRLERLCGVRSCGWTGGHRVGALSVTVDKRAKEGAALVKQIDVQASSYLVLWLKYSTRRFNLSAQLMIIPLSYINILVLSHWIRQG
jgi:hypothetical protein